MSITVDLSDSDTELIKNYAAMKGTTISDIMRKAIIERIEDEIDLELYNHAVAEYQADSTTYSHDEVGKMLGIHAPNCSHPIHRLDTPIV